MRAAHALIARGGYREAQVAGGGGAGPASRPAPSTATSRRRPTSSPRSSGAPRSARSTPRARQPTPPAHARRAHRPPRSRRSRAARCAGRRAGLGAASPSRSTRRSRSSASPSAAPTPPASSDVLRDGRGRRRAARPRTSSSTAAALVGALGEALVGPLSPPVADGVDADALVADLVSLLPALRHRGDHLMLTTPTATHEVLNQVPPLEDRNLFEDRRRAAGGARARGRRLGASTACAAGRLLRAASRGAGASSADERHEPRAAHARPLRPPRRRGRARPAWHWLLRAGVEREIHALPWRDRPAGRPRRARGRRYVLLVAQAERGLDVPDLDDLLARSPPCARSPTLAAEWEPRLTRQLDPDCERTGGALCGMAMTEKQGGSDVRANTTRARAGDDGWWEITGHKWFCSYPPCDIFLVLAQTRRRRSSCFSCCSTARARGFQLQRLKDKLGTRSLPSSEVEFRGAAGRLRRRGGPRRARRSSRWSTTRGWTA